MEKLKYIKIEHEDGTLSDNVPIGADVANIDVSNTKNLATKLNEIDSAISQTNSNINLEAQRRANADSNLQTQINGVINYNPIPVSSTSEMTDHSKIYVLTTTGHWYYWNSNSNNWTDGGVYQSSDITNEVVAARSQKNTDLKFNELKDRLDKADELYKNNNELFIKEKIIFHNNEEAKHSSSSVSTKNSRFFVFGNKICEFTYFLPYWDTSQNLDTTYYWQTFTTVNNANIAENVNTILGEVHTEQIGSPLTIADSILISPSTGIRLWTDNGTPFKYYSEYQSYSSDYLRIGKTSAGSTVINQVIAFPGTWKAKYRRKERKNFVSSDQTGLSGFNTNIKWLTDNQVDIYENSYYDNSKQKLENVNFECLEYTFSDSDLVTYSKVIGFSETQEGWAAKNYFLDDNNNIISFFTPPVDNVNSFIFTVDIPANARKIRVSTRKNSKKYIFKIGLTTHPAYPLLDEMHGRNIECPFDISPHSRFSFTKSGNNIIVHATAGVYYLNRKSSFSQTKVTLNEDVDFTIPEGFALIIDYDDMQFKVLDYRNANNFIPFGRSPAIIAFNGNGHITSGLMANSYLNNRINNITPTNNMNYLENKKIVAIGDSMTKGHTLSDSQTWLAKIANRNNMTHVNYGYNGCNLSYVDGGASYPKEVSVYARYENMDDDADYILVFAGTNDITRSVSLGTENSDDPTTFYGAVNKLCDGLQTKYPNKKIGFISPYSRPGQESKTPQYVEALEKACGNHGIPVFNNVKNGGINWTNTAQKTSLTLGDNTHLNEAGNEFASYKFENFLRSL